MPEFYEVKRMAAYLHAAGIVGKTIASCEITPKGARCFKTHSAAEASAFFTGNTLIHITTKAKYTLLSFKTGASLWHYRFTGIPHIVGKPYSTLLTSLYQLPIATYSPSHCRFRFTFCTGQQLDYVDTRCLSHVAIHPTCNTAAAFTTLTALASDLDTPLRPSFDQWRQWTRSKRYDLKTYLLDQYTPPSGIGNYLACEICHAAQLSPWKPISTFTEGTVQRLFDAIVTIDQHCRLHVDYPWFKVYNRKHCRSCGETVHHQKHRSRSSQRSWWCPNCLRDS